MPQIDLASQVAPTRRIAIRTGLPALALLVLIGVIGACEGFDVTTLVRDPASLGHIPPWYGAISNLGVLLWWSTATLCAFTAFRVRTSPERPFLLGGAGLSALLCFDDLFMLHEKVFRVDLGIPQKLTYAAYATFAVLYLFQFRNYILAGEWGPLLLALGFLGISVVADVVMTYLPKNRAESFYEDGAKFVGIALWLGYFWNECRRALSRSPG